MTGAPDIARRAQQLATIAVYSFREAVRNKVLYVIVFFAVTLMLLSLVLGGASLAQSKRVVLDVGLMALNVFTNISAVVVGVTTIYNELERKTIYNLLSKPVTRWTYYIGKYLGLLLTVAVLMALMVVALVVTLLVNGAAPTLSLVGALWLLFVQSALIAAFASFFSSFSTPYLSGFMTAGIALIGTMVDDLEGLTETFESEAAARALNAVVSVLPELDLFVVSRALVYEIPVPVSFVGAVTLYGMMYSCVLLALGGYIFSRRDFI